MKSKKNQEIFLSTELVTLKNFIRKNRIIDIGPEHCFDVSNINNNFIQLEAERLNDITYFPGSQTNLE